MADSNTAGVNAAIDGVAPRVIPTRYGFLAISGYGAEFAIGVVGDTENQVLGLYDEAVRRRREILARP